MKKCKEVMTKDPECCLPTDTAVDAARLMKDENVGPIPIVADRQSKKLLGIVTDRDIVVKVVAEGRDPKTTRLEEIMTRNPVTCRADDDLETAMQAMAKHQIRRILVVDNGNRLVGIISQADVARHAEEPEDTGKVVEEISKPSTMQAR